jgi:hypothetical protein
MPVSRGRKNSALWSAKDSEMKIELPQFSTHENPVWREKANYIINLPTHWDGRYEQMWCRQVQETEFEVCCIPYFLYDIALGDILKAVPIDRQRHGEAVVKECSGRGVFRVYFEVEQYRNQKAISADLNELGALVESWRSSDLLAVDARDDGQYQLIGNFLTRCSSRGFLSYESGSPST